MGRAAQTRVDGLVRLAAMIGGVAAMASCASLQAMEGVVSPPSQFQLDRTVMVEFVAPEAVGARCAARGVRFFGLPGFNSGACSSAELVTLPAPCAFAGEAYARGLCAGVEARQRIAFVHPDLAAASCPARGDAGAADVVLCSEPEMLVVANPCLAAERGWYAETLCHELAHANGWPADHAGGSGTRQPSFVKAHLAADDVLSPEAVRVALLAKAAGQRD